MHRAYICSPLGGNVSANIENAKRYARYALECGMAPFIPHFYALILNDDNKEERILHKLKGKKKDLPNKEISKIKLQIKIPMKNPKWKLLQMMNREKLRV